ncbi:hypothetical protein, partial [Paraburkholderia sp. SIMBA_027]|uniref:hypothetical protein n=1 Tax=Paraburkholderia sp. SIMBA_027 TaxID=3085770 RepID=UPI00397E5EF4
RHGPRRCFRALWRPMKLLTLTAACLFFITAVTALFSNHLVAVLALTAAVAMVATYVFSSRQGNR